MSNIKDLFSGKKSEKLLENATGRSVGSSVESADYLRSNIKNKKRFIPHVDFSSASNFAIYGSAEKYYEDAYNYILNEYPYDGSLKDKINWSLAGTYLDRYIFENEYPRTTGYINIGKSYGSVTDAGTGYDAPSKREWIFFKGNNVNYSLNSQTNPELTLQFDNLNIYNTASQGLSNLELEGSGGLSVEFWLNKSTFNASDESNRQVIVDIWNSGTYDTAGYGRFRVEISGTEVGVVNPNFNVELLSGSAGFSWQGVTPGGIPSVVLSGSTLTGSWNHFALTFVNTGSQMAGRLYTNGDLTYTYTGGTTMGIVTGSMLGQIGSLITAVSGGNEIQGDGKFSGSLDEFRFWKTRRNATQIGQHWFTQVGGGTNTDITLATSASTKYSYENPVDLGVYYKFNEGIINTSSVNGNDAVVIDYAGRVTNGQWEGYSVASRNTGSAMVSASVVPYEFPDPILYSTNPLVAGSLTDKKNIGKLYDVTNNSSMFDSLPHWITAQDGNTGNGALKNLTQIMSSFFDTLYLQTKAITGLKNKDYISGSDKPFPFVNRFIDSSGFLTSEIFSKASDLEYLDARNDKKLFTAKINELKNLIYQNVYNNLVYVYKTKGTMKSFRNLIRCFGVDDELINIRLYGDQVTYKIQDNYKIATIKKRYANFHNASNFNAVVFQEKESGNTYSRGYISSSGEVKYRGNTYELEAFFPKDKEKGTSVYFNAAFPTASIFGCHTSGAVGTVDWGSPDHGNFQVKSIRTDIRRKAAYFHLTGTAGGFFPLLTSSVFQDVYDGTRWNFAVRVKPKKYPLAAGVSGSDEGQYDVEFSGYNYVLDVLNNSFIVTASLDKTSAQSFLTANKRFFVGAHRTNTVGAVLQGSNVKASSLRVWMDYLTSGTLQAHAKDITNFGSANPYRDAYITAPNTTLGSKDVKAIPQLETLILNWNFDTLTGSNAGGNFTVPDVSIASSGTNDYTARWGWLGPIGQYQHTGYGYGFAASSTSSIDNRYVHTVLQQPPEVINSSDMISLIDKDRNSLLGKDSRPEQYFFAFEKSMYNIITKEMLDIFGTIVDFNNLIGEPVNRYREQYKNMEKLRQLYFERVQNTIDLDKFVEYFKWLDSALSVMLQQLVPGSARFSENLRTMVESHVLERNKYRTKFPTLEMKQTDPEAGLFGITEMLYPYKRGHAPSSAGPEGSAQCVGWKTSVGNALRAGSCGGLRKNVAGAALWNTWAHAVPIGVDSSVTFQGRTIDVSNKVGLKTTAGEVGDEDLIDFSFYFDGDGDVGPVNTLYIRENGADPTGGLSWTLTTFAHRWRITRNIGGTVFYQKSEDAGATFTTIYTSAKTTTDILYPVISMEAPGDSTHSGLENAWIHPINRTDTQCFWWKNRAPARLTTAGDATIDNQRDTFRLAGDFRSASGPTLAVSRNSTANTTTYTGQAYALRDFTRIIRLSADESPEIHGGSNFARNKTVEYTHTALKFDSPNQLQIAASSIPGEIGCDDVIIPNSKFKLEAKVTNTVDPNGYTSGKSEIFAPFSLYSSSVVGGYLSDVATNFRSNTEIDNYHDDIYGDDKGIPAQGPFTERHVGGRQHRHLDVNTSSATTIFTRAEAWNLSLASNTLTISPRTVHQPRATMIRDAYAKRPLNIANIEWGTSSAVAGNYRFGYEVLQTSGRYINNRYFVKAGGFRPNVNFITASSTYISGVVDFALPRYDLTGATDSIFVERFSAPGGPEVSRGRLDVNAEELGVYNNLNYRNLIVRNALNGWQTDHCGQFGIASVSGTTRGYRQPRWQNYKTLASYHKVNRNGRQAALLKDGYDRELEFTELFNVTLSNYNRTLTGRSSPGSASCNQKIERFGYFEVELNEASSGEWMMGLTQVKSFCETDGSGPTWEYTWGLNYGSLTVRENGSWRASASGVVAIGDKIRIVKSGTKVKFQHKSVSSTDWITVWSSATEARGTFFPVAAFGNAYGFTNPRISNPSYDNWFVRHTLPQSALQYAWINKSYDIKQDQPYGYNGSCHDYGGLIPFSVPSGTTSMTASAVKILTGTLRYIGHPDSLLDHPIPVAFNSLFTIAGRQYSKTHMYGYNNQITASTNTISPGYFLLRNGGICKDISYYYLNLNGPYGYPSWKQIRVGETPLARYQKRYNILSVMAPPSIATIAGREPESDAVQYGGWKDGKLQTLTWFNTRREGYKNFVEPPVTFKYRPLRSTLQDWNMPSKHLTLQHSYANNKGLWTQRGLPLNDPNAKSVAEFLKVLNYKSDAQIYDKLNESEQYNSQFEKLSYSEVIYPREANTGLAKTRGRIKYAETASVINLWRHSPLTATLSLGSNGIDRGPLYRRTFWAYPDRRNRHGAPDAPATVVGSSYPWFTTTISNSCGNQDGNARSVWCFGEEPIVFGPPTASDPTTFGKSAFLSASSGYAKNDGQDTGELNSINIMKIGGLMGGVSGSGLVNSFAHRFYTRPSASAYYYWLPYYGIEAVSDAAPAYCGSKGCNAIALGTRANGRYTYDFCKGMKWTAAKDSGKAPWFDSYEEYAEDIRGLSKAWTVLPEFRISDHMSYYIKDKSGDFRSKNDKFLSLNGANVTQSADREDALPSEPLVRDFDHNFFKEYSFSDFQKYFGTFAENKKLDHISLKCNVVKKLLPYKGFYPADRSTQLVSLFSGALGSHLGGGAVTGSAGVGISARTQSGSQQLALQALLQPWFAPGILYNTIKSGIAVDWPVMTGSMLGVGVGGYAGNRFLSGNANTRFPFQSLLDPLDYVPVSESNGSHKLLFLAPSYMNESEHKREPMRIPFAEFAPAHPPGSVMDLYSSAMHNYLAEIPHFFLKNYSLNSIESVPQDQVTIGKDDIYVMDVYIEKTNTKPSNELIMIQDYYNGYVSASFGDANSKVAMYGTTWGGDGGTGNPALYVDVTASYNGRYFGPKWTCNMLSLPTPSNAGWYAGWGPLRDADPCYAPHTPPYFYGKARARLVYTGSADDAARVGAGTGPNFRTIFNDMVIGMKGATDPRNVAWTKYKQSAAGTLWDKGGYRFSSAYQNMMDITASLDLLGIRIVDSSNDGLNRWVIAPYMETPVLDFSQSLKPGHPSYLKGQTPEPGYGRGMWSGYGEVPQSHKGIFFGLQNATTEESLYQTSIGQNPAKIKDMTEWFRSEGFETPRRQIGRMAPRKTISEAIVAIPFYVGAPYGSPDTRAKLTVPSIMGKRFFSLGSTKTQSRNLYNTLKNNAINGGWAIPFPSDLATQLGKTEAVSYTSISQMGLAMDRYIFPPELDFNKYSDIEPFAMYIMEFHHTLQQQDLVDIWQGLMPKISIRAELDEAAQSWPNAKGEFFGGKRLPRSENIRWMVFKVKRKAHVNYWAITPTTEKGPTLRRAAATVNPLGFDYSYNWPYDHFSLVELAEIKTEANFVKQPEGGDDIGEIPDDEGGPGAAEGGAAGASGDQGSNSNEAGGDSGATEGGAAGASGDRD